MTRILLVDDHILFREGLVGLLEGQPDFHVVGQAGTVGEAIELTDKLKPDLILMDFSLPDGTGLAATQTILAKHPDIDIVFLTVHEEDDRLFEAIRCGAKGYLLKNVPVAKLLVHLRGIEQGEAAVSKAMVSRILTEFSRQRPNPLGNGERNKDVDVLTSRETEVLQVLATGATNQEIATHLIISENTVKNHVRSILTKLHLKNRREAIRYAKRHGLTDPSPNSSQN